MKQYLFILIFFISVSLQAQHKKIDSAAVAIVDRMTNIIGDLNSCSFQLERSFDVKNQFGWERNYSSDEVYLQSPNKMFVEIEGNHDHRGYWYNGEILVYYSFNENNYSVLEAPSTIIDMIDGIHQNFGIEFPAADIFYPEFTEDLMTEYDKIIYLGEKEIAGQTCYHIMAVNKKTNLQLWISNSSFMLPKKMLVISKDKGNKQYEITFKNWQLNTKIPSTLFNFTPPPNAKNISIMIKS